MVKERFRLLFEGERLFGVIDCQYEVFKKHGNTKKNNVKIGHHLNGVSGDREREKRWREYVGVGGKGKAGDRESGALGALGTEKESKKVKMSDTPERSDSAFSANDCPPLAKCTRERPTTPQ